MHKMNRQIDLSIIVEMENVLLSEDERCFLMLRQLREQLAEINRTAEVIVLINPDQTDRDSIETALRKHFGQGNPEALVDLRLEVAQGSHYYELKNKGAALARGQIVIFIDSDVVPEDNWLKEISQPFFDHSGIDVVAGHTYLPHDSLYEKAFALGWFFPVRDPENRLHSANKKFYANNVAFRREVFLKYLFPSMPTGVRRGACGQIARTLASSGIYIWTNTAARVHHPPPSGLQHYMIRALAHGRDNVLHKTGVGYMLFTAFSKNLLWIIYRVVTMGRRMISERQQVNLRFSKVPAAFTIMMYFYWLAFLGSLAAVLFPDYARKHWQI